MEKVTQEFQNKINSLNQNKKEIRNEIDGEIKKSIEEKYELSMQILKDQMTK
jgi:hypothetical protein